MDNSNVVIFFKNLPKLFLLSLKELKKNDPLRMAGATAFFTTFALPPILILLTQAMGLIFEKEEVRSQLFTSLSQIIGTSSIEDLTRVVEEMRKLSQNWLVTLGGFLFLVFVATTLFNVIRHSINQIWKIRESKKRNFLKKLSDRLRSILVILGAGILFVFGIVTEGMEALVGNYIRAISPVLAFYFTSAFNYVFSILIVTLWFSILFRYIPDGRPNWKVALTGAFLTSILFNIGKFLLRILLGASNINTLYGASGSIVLLLLFVFYSSFILYFGAAFTKMWSIHNGAHIAALPYASHYQLTEVPEDDE